EEALFRRQILACLHRFRSWNLDDLGELVFVYRIARDLRNEVGRPALHWMGLPRRMRLGGRAIAIGGLALAARQRRRVRRFADYDLGVRAFLAQHTRNAGERPARAITRHPVIEPVAPEILDDLARRRAFVDGWIGVVFELARHEPAML